MILTGTRAQRGKAVSARERLAGVVVLVAALQVLMLLVTSARYGYHRDELYFIVAGSHPAFGYPDQPPLVPLISQAMQQLAPGSLLMLRTPSALVAGATTVLAALIASELGGARRAQIIAAACTAVSGFALAVGHFVTTTTFDMLSTTLLGWLMIRAVRRQSPGHLLAAGLVVGIGFEAKPQVGLVAVVMAAALLALGPRALLRTPQAIGGALVAIVLALPYLIWQQQHGWPQATVAGNIAGSEEGGRAGFIPFQLVMVSPVLVPVWVAGLRAPFNHAGWGSLRFVAVAYLGLAVLYLLGNGKAYYLASLYPVLLGLGAIPAGEWTQRGSRRTWTLAAAIGLSGAFSAIIALPLLPERSLQGSIVIALNNAQGETVGWPRYISTISAAWRRIPPATRSRTAILTANYGEAGAIDLLATRRQLPLAYSGHNGFSEWGEPPARDTEALLTGFYGGVPRPGFDRCRRLAVMNNGVGLNNQEQGDPFLLCRLTVPWSRLWPRLRHYD